MVRYVFAYGVNLARFRIYKQTDSVVENQAMRGARSDEEFTRNISSVLKANFNGYNSNQSDLHNEIIAEYQERQLRIKEEERERNELEQNKKKDRLASIFAMNH